MRIAYFDCFAGASGDMILGSLFDAGLDFKVFQREIDGLGVQGYELHVKRSVKKGISGTKFTVKVTEEQKDRHLSDILRIIDDSQLSEGVKQKGRDVFSRLAQAEAAIHGKSVDEVHFHEVGAVDSIVDIMGTVLGLELLGVDQVHASRIHVGTGFLECAHGTLPVPPPATLNLLKDLPIISRGIQSELVTPTGAALLSTLSSGFGVIPSMSVESCGYGFGTKDLPIANFLRVILGTCREESAEDSVQIIETNIDDMNPQFYDHIMGLLFTEGAKDVFLTPVIMKKNRPGVVLSVVSNPADVTRLVETVLRETTTLGVRVSEVKMRHTLSREIVKVNTSLGEARVKVRIREGETPIYAPEYDDCKRLAKEHGRPILEVYELIREEAVKQQGT